MNFTYHSYCNFLLSLQKHGYSIKNYHDWTSIEKCVILRHDIDNDIEKAYRFAQLEADMEVTSTYFVLVTSDFYNIFSLKNEKLLKGILHLGHHIGLHFDELGYLNLKSPDDVLEKIQKETSILEKAIENEVSVVSMHRPSKMILESNLSIPGMINSYSQTFFKEFKYLSDSRRNWREPIDNIIESEEFPRLHVLTHAFWYNDIEIDIHDSICNFVNQANMQRYESEKSNITNIESIMKNTEVK